MARGLKTQWFHILLALVDTPRHGSAIRDEVLRQSGGRIRLWPTTLYGSLDELVSMGLLETLDGARHPRGESERRRFYRLTEAGLRAARDESSWYRSVAELAAKRLGEAAKSWE